MKSNERIAVTPEPPYYSVVFTSRRTAEDDGGYAVAVERMIELAAQQVEFLGLESVRDTARVGITVSYWRDFYCQHRYESSRKKPFDSSV